MEAHATSRARRSLSLRCTVVDAMRHVDSTLALSVSLLILREKEMETEEEEGEMYTERGAATLRRCISNYDQRRW